MAVDLPLKIEGVADGLDRVLNGPRHGFHGLLNGPHRGVHGRARGLHGFRDLLLQRLELVGELQLGFVHLLSDHFRGVVHEVVSCKILWPDFDMLRSL